MLEDVVAADEPDFRGEVVADEQALHLDAVAVAGVIHLQAVAGVVARESRRFGLRPVGVERQVVEERERAVDAVGVVAPEPARPSDRPV